MTEHDKWLAGYRQGHVEVWCSNPSCPIHKEGMTVHWESEYGQATNSPEECPVCHSAWQDDKPEEDDEDKCDECGASLDDGEGYDGFCGDCADKKEAEGYWN